MWIKSYSLILLGMEIQFLLMRLLCLDKFVMLPVSDLGRIHAGHHIFAALIKAPIGLVDIVIRKYSVDLFYVETEFTFGSLKQFVFTQSIGKSFCIGMKRDRDRLTVCLDLHLYGLRALSKLDVLPVYRANLYGILN